MGIGFGILQGKVGMHPMGWLQRLMYGRYGGDSLNIALLIFSVIVSIVLRVVGGIVHLPWLAVFTAIPVGLVIFRMFSKNIARRQKENQVFLKIFRRSAGSVKQKTARAQDTLHKYYRCPKCKQQLRVPKGRGKICIICPKCKHEFIKKT